MGHFLSYLIQGVMGSGFGFWLSDSRASKISHNISGSFLGVISPPNGHLAMSGDNVGCHKWQEEVLLTSSAWKLRTLLTTFSNALGVPHDKLSAPKCQERLGSETLHCTVLPHRNQVC